MIQVSSTSEPEEACSKDELHTIVEASPGNHYDLRKTLENILLVKQRNNTPLVSFDATKTLVSNADVKVHYCHSTYFCLHPFIIC